jgi:hypothetical protein
MGWEVAFTAIAVGLSFAWPRIASGTFQKIQHQFSRLAHRRRLSLLVVGLSVLILRFSILPLLPIPAPFTVDDYSNLLAADTFAHGRLANPTPAMWVHFESIHIDMRPTYTSMYFPGQGLLMAAGKKLFGNFWLAVPFAAAGMCAAICWMLQGWLPAPWALLGGFIAVLRLGVFSYWTNTYHTAGTLAALGGALVLGSLPRFQRSPRGRYGLIMATGVVLLIVTRPYEGALLCLVVAIALIRWAWKRRVPGRALIWAALPGVILLALGIAWQGYYDLRAFGNPLTPPYSVNRATYATAPYYVWQQPRPEPAYHHPLMRQFYKVYELDDYKRVHSLSGLPFMTLVKALRGILFFSGVVFLPALFMLPRALRDRRIRLLVISLVVLACGMAIEIYLMPHYLAPFTAAFYAVGIQCLRHLWLWRPGDQPVGIAMVRFTVVICILMAGIRVFDRQLGCPVPGYPFSTWICNWFGPDHFVPERDRVRQVLAQNPGGQLAIVRYSPDHDALDEWVYNSADIDSSKVIWAWDMGDATNQELIRYYKDRKVWLVQPDAPSAEIAPYPPAGGYPVPGQVTRASSN